MCWERPCAPEPADFGGAHGAPYAMLSPDRAVSRQTQVLSLRSRELRRRNWSLALTSRACSSTASSQLCRPSGSLRYRVVSPSWRRLVALAAGFDLERQQVDIGHLQLFALAVFQGAALQGRGMGKGRVGEHDLLALVQVGPWFAVMEPVAAYIALEVDAQLAVIVDFQPQAT